MREVASEARQELASINNRARLQQLTARDAYRLLELMNRMLTALPPPRPETPQLPAKRGRKNHHLPEDWAPSDETLAWARERCPEVDLHVELEKFTNYYRSVDGPRARRTNWELTFRNWALRAKSDYRARPQRQSRDEKREAIVRAAVRADLDDPLF